MRIEITVMKSEDWDDVAAIYQEGIDTLIATFADGVPTYAEWDAAHCARCRLVARENGEVVGFAALSPISSRACYAGVAEISLYIKSTARGRHVGTLLMRAAIDAAFQNGFLALHSLVIRENAVSLALHGKCGFRVVGFWEAPAYTKDGVYHDVVLLECRKDSKL